MRGGQRHRRDVVSVRRSRRASSRRPACEVDALVDTGSPATIVNEALATAAGLFAIEDAEDEQGQYNGLGGAAAAAAVPGGGHPLGGSVRDLRATTRHLPMAWRVSSSRLTDPARRHGRAAQDACSTQWRRPLSAPGGGMRVGGSRRAAWADGARPGICLHGGPTARVGFRSACEVGRTGDARTARGAGLRGGA